MSSLFIFVAIGALLGLVLSPRTVLILGAVLFAIDVAAAVVAGWAGSEWSAWLSMMTMGIPVITALATLGALGVQILKRFLNE